MLSALELRGSSPTPDLSCLRKVVGKTTRGHSSGEVDADDVSAGRHLQELETSTRVGLHTERLNVAGFADVFSRHHLHRDVAGRLTRRLPDNSSNAPIESQTEVRHGVGSQVRQLERLTKVSRGVHSRGQHGDFVFPRRNGHFVLPAVIGRGTERASRTHDADEHVGDRAIFLGLTGREMAFPVSDGPVDTRASAMRVRQSLQKAQVFICLGDEPCSRTDAGDESLAVRLAPRVDEVAFTFLNV